MTMGTFSSSFIRMICSRSSASSDREDMEVMEKTRRKPWPCFMYSSLELRGGGEGLDGAFYFLFFFLG